MATLVLQANATAGVSPRDADAMSRRGFSFRLGFAVLASLAALPVTPLSWLAAWLLLVAVWEFWLAQFLTNALIWPVYVRDPKGANLRQTGVVALGAILFGAFPFLTWASDEILGAVLAIAWMGGTAIHVFVYLSNHRFQLIAGLAPPVAAALVLPGSTLGLSLETLTATLAALYLIGAAAIFAFDRNAILVDMTKEKAAREAAEETARAKNEFLRVLTHELRTPINQIVGYAGLLAEDIEAGVAKARDAAEIEASGKALLVLVNRAIEISQLQAGAVALDPFPVSVRALLEDAAQQIEAAAARSGNKVIVEAPDDDDVISIDGERLLQCLYCLSENAAKFCKDGAITFSAVRVGKEIVFAVADTGPGMTHDVLERVSGPLTQGDGTASRAHEGLGLGLTFARALASALGGSLQLISAPGQGTRAQLKVAADIVSG